MLVIWPLQFTVARAILLGLQAIGLLGTLGKASALGSGTPSVAWEILGVVVSIGFIVLLTPSLIHRRPSSR